MGGRIANFDALIERAVKAISSVRGRAVVAFSDDGDGVASAVLLDKLLSKLGIEGYYVCVDKPYPDFVKTIIEDPLNKMYIFVDLGGPIHKLIPRESYEKVLIIDHHIEETAIPDDLLVLNPLLCGIEEAEAPSSSTIIYHMLRKLGRDAPNWSWIALIGVGELPSYPAGLNWAVVADGLKSKVIGRTEKSFKVNYEGINREYRSLYKDLTLIASAGYYEGAPLKLLEILSRGYGKEISNRADAYKRKRNEIFKRLLKTIEEEGMSEGNTVQWFEDYHNDFYNVSTRLFDSFTTYVSHQARLYKKDKYIIGLCKRKPYVPGHGYLSKDWANIAIRVSKYLSFKIRAGRAQPISALAEATAYALEGIGYGYKDKGCAIIACVFKESFLKLFDELASEKL